MKIKRWIWENGMVKECVTFTSNPRSNAKAREIATMVRRSLIRFDKLGSIQNQKRDKALTIIKIQLILFHPYKRKYIEIFLYQQCYILQIPQPRMPNAIITSIIYI